VKASGGSAPLTSVEFHAFALPLDKMPMSKIVASATNDERMPFEVPMRRPISEWVAHYYGRIKTPMPRSGNFRMSAFRGKADMTYCSANVRFWPEDGSPGLAVKPTF
jgi:hypothetical protein